MLCSTRTLKPRKSFDYIKSPSFQCVRKPSIMEVAPHSSFAHLLYPEIGKLIARTADTNPPASIATRSQS